MLGLGMFKLGVDSALEKREGRASATILAVTRVAYPALYSAVESRRLDLIAGAEPDRALCLPCKTKPPRVAAEVAAWTIFRRSVCESGAGKGKALQRITSRYSDE